MYQLLLDAIAALRLRFFKAEHYHYQPSIIAAALAVISAVNAAAMAPLFGNDAGAVGFAFALTILKWLLLSVVMAAVLHYYGAAKLRLYSYIAMTELLAAPLIAMLYWPQALGFIGMLWQTWIFVVQIIGLTRLSQLSGGKVLLGYAAYFVALMLSGSLLLLVFNLMGWLDVDALAAQMQQLSQTSTR